MNQKAFDIHAKVLGLNAEGSGLAFLMRKDNPELWRLEFSNEDKKVGLCWYVGDKMYHLRLTDQQYLKLTTKKVDELAAKVEYANVVHDRYMSQLKAIPKDLKETLTQAVV